jgi:hypothetical protein
VLSTQVLVIGRFCEIDEVGAENCEINVHGNTLRKLFAAVGGACGLFCAVWNASFAMRF